MQKYKHESNHALNYKQENMFRYKNSCHVMTNLSINYHFVEKYNHIKEFDISLCRFLVFIMD